VNRSHHLVELTEVDFEDSSASADTAIVQSENRVAVTRAIGKLSLEHRQVIALRFQAELSYEKMAEVLDLPLGTVKSRLFMAVRNCRNLLKNEGLIE